MVAYTKKKVGSGSCVGSLVAVCARSGSAISNPHFLQIPILLRLRLDRRAEGALRRPRGARGARDGTLRRARLRGAPGGCACGAGGAARLLDSCVSSQSPVCIVEVLMGRVIRDAMSIAPRLSGRPPASRQSAWGAPGAGGARAARALRCVWQDGAHLFLAFFLGATWRMFGLWRKFGHFGVGSAPQPQAISRARVPRRDVDGRSRPPRHGARPPSPAPQQGAHARTAGVGDGRRGLAR